MKESLCGDFLNSKKVLYPFFERATEYLVNKKCDFMPVAVEIHPTAKCNHACIHCSYKERNEGREELDRITFEKLINSVIKMRVKGVFFSGGGEPCIYPYLKEAITKLNESGIEVAIITNGSLFERMGLIDSAKYLNYIAVSVPSVNSAMFKKITGKQYVDEILSLPQRIRAVHGTDSPIIGARVVITSLIVDEVPLILETLKECEYDYALFKIVRDYENRGLGVSKEAEKELRKRIETMKLEGSIEPSYTNLDSIFEYKKPYSPERTCHINKMGMLAVVTPSGDVFHNISEIVFDDLKIGNLHDCTLDQMWNGEMHNLVKERSHDLWVSGNCRNCRAIEFNGIINEVLCGIPMRQDSFL